MYLVAFTLLACEPGPGSAPQAPLPHSGASHCRPTRWFADADHDGYGDSSVSTRSCTAPFAYVADPSDCDDTRSDTHPGGSERCDGIDQNCDGVPDDASVTDPAVWYPDADGDGFGAEGPEVTACAAPRGTVANASDCDDTNPSANPGGVESCSPPGVDEDCDGLVDDDDGVPAGATAWYPDADGDGFGREGSAPTWACVAPSGYGAGTGDCNDFDATIVPSAWYTDADADGYGAEGSLYYACAPALGSTEIGGDCDDTRADVVPGQPDGCADPADEDCDGDLVEVAAFDCDRWYPDQDGDGSAGTTGWSCQCIGTATYISTSPDDCDDADPTRFPGAVETCNDGIDQNCDGDDPCTTADAATVLIGNTPGSASGSHVAIIPDIDGDGVSDWIIAAPDETAVDVQSGAVWVVSGSTRGTGTLMGLATGDVYGSGIAAHLATGGMTGCDLDGDGVGDIVAGEAGRTNDVGLWLGPGLTGSLADAAVRLDYPPGTALGTSVACGGDTDGDGSPDVLVGSIALDGTTTRGGGVWFFGAPPTADTPLTDASTTLEGSTVDGLAGANVGFPGDLNGDGFDDLWVSAPGAHESGGRNGAGVVYLEYGPLSDGVFALSSASAVWSGVSTYEDAGTSVAAPGDTDGDGLPDLVIGGEFRRVYIVRDHAEGLFSLSNAEALLYSSTINSFGNAVGAGGDLDGDGTPDIAVGAPDDGSVGRVYLFDGDVRGVVYNTSARLTIDGTAPGGEFGGALAMTPDGDADGKDELLVTAPLADTVGVTYLFLGGTLYP